MSKTESYWFPVPNSALSSFSFLLWWSTVVSHCLGWILGDIHFLCLLSPAPLKPSTTVFQSISKVQPGNIYIASFLPRYQCISFPTSILHSHKMASASFWYISYLPAGEIPWSRRWFSYSKPYSLHSGYAYPCNSSKYGKLDHIICGSGGVCSYFP